MDNNIPPPLNIMRERHMAVRLEDTIVVFGGITGTYRKREGYELSMRNIWMYNLYTNHWMKYVIPQKATAPLQTDDGCAAAIGSEIYMFGGNIRVGSFCRTNALWKLSRSNDWCFRWSEIQLVNSELPSPRNHQCGWEYESKLWIFGGCGPRASGNPLNNHGKSAIPISTASGINNQLLCYDPCSQTWTNPACSGNVPLTHTHYAAAVVRDQVWLCPKRGAGLSYIYKLDMHSLAWTRITVNKGILNYSLSLTAITDKQLVLLHSSGGGYIHAWLLNTENMSQSRIDQPFHESPSRCNYTAIAGLNSSTIVIGGWDPLAHSPSTFSVMLEPKSLQQLAMQMIHEHRTDTCWKRLPKKLIYKIMAWKNDKDI